MEQEEEFEVIRAVLAGSRNEFRHLVRNHRSYVYTLVMRQVGSAPLAEELTQEVFLRAYRGLKGFRFDSKFSTWLTRIALNQTKSYFRSRRFRETNAQEVFEEVAHPCLGETAEDVLLSAEKVRKLQQGIAQLPPQFRDVLVLCAFERKSYEEVSEILSIPVGTVRSRLNRARHQLKSFYFEGVQ